MDPKRIEKVIEHQKSLHCGTSLRHFFGNPLISQVVALLAGRSWEGGGGSFANGWEVVEMGKCWEAGWNGGGGKTWGGRWLGEVAGGGEVVMGGTPNDLQDPIIQRGTRFIPPPLRGGPKFVPPCRLGMLPARVKIKNEMRTNMSIFFAATYS